MKFISLLVFALALWASWHFARQPLPVAESVHVGIQDDLKSIIADYVQKNVETARNIQFERMWTETISDNKVRAQFIYSFEEPDDKEGATRVTIAGYAILNKTSESPEQVQYSMDELHIQNNSIIFDEPMKITTGADDEAE